MPDLPLVAIRSAENLGGAGGFHRGVKAAYDAGHDRIWLMDDDVVPAPECLRVMADHPGPALMAVREDRSGRVCEKAATRFDLVHPWAVRPKREMVEDRYPERRLMPAEVAAGERRVRGLHGPPTRGGRGGAARPGLLHLLRRRRLRRAGAACRLRHPGAARRGAGAAAGLRPAARHEVLEGLLHVPQPLRGAPPLRRERPGAPQAVAHHARRAAAGARCAAACAEARNVTKALRDAPRLARTSPPRG